MKNIVILGSTGSIGKNTLEIVRKFKEEFNLLGISANKNIELLLEQVEEFKPEFTCVVSEREGKIFKDIAAERGLSTKLLLGEEGLLDLVSIDRVDIILIAIVGFAGFLPTYKALKMGKRVALANKESLVSGGELISKLEEGEIIPVDSEHSAIFQCLRGENIERVEKLILTASGGPFFRKDVDKFDEITVGDALNHPKWDMGAKITIDSSTMMNKGLEVIEAHYLFGIPPEKIDVVIHPQSVVHSMVEFVDGSIISQLGITDMKLPIGYALFYPERVELGYERLSLFDVSPLEFYPPDFKKFPCLKLAFDALKAGNSFPIVLNSANEVAVKSFLTGEIGFTDIPAVIEETLSKFGGTEVRSVEDVIYSHKWGEKISREIVYRLRKRI